MKTIVLLIMFCSAILAQQKAETEPWLVDPAYVKNCVYVVQIGRNPHEAFLRSLAGLAEKLRMSASDMQPDLPAGTLAVLGYSFGRVNILYSGSSNRKSLENEDTLDYHTTISFSATLRFSDKSKSCFMKLGNKILYRADAETFAPSVYNSKTNSDETLTYEFKGMNFADLLDVLEGEGITAHFKSDGGVTYALLTYPLSKVK